MTRREPLGRSRHGRRGQALVEFALVLVPLIILLVGLFDLGRGVYTYNAVAEAAREIARETAVHPYTSCTLGSCVLGSSPEVAHVISTQQRMVPGLLPTSITITCTDLAGATKLAVDCRPGDYATVSASVAYTPITPFVSLIGPITLSATGQVQFP